jgi:hypothetical protein
VNRGISPLGLCHERYPVGRLIKAFERAPVIRFGWIDHTFNPHDSANALRILRLPQPKLVRIHIINGPGLNNNRVQPYEIAFGETSQSLSTKIIQQNEKFLLKFRRRLETLRALLERASGETQLLVSPWLEAKQADPRAIRILGDEILKVLPQAQLVSNPLDGRYIPGWLKEAHSNTPDPQGIDIVDLDGTDWERVDLRKYANRFQSLKACFIWGLGENGFDNIEDGTPWKPPLKRTDFSKERSFTQYNYFIRDDALKVRSELNKLDILGLKLQDATDGRQGFVWKLGDDKNYAVCLFPKECQRFDRVAIRKGGRVLDFGKLRGRYTEDGSNRLIYDFTVHPARLPDNSVLQADRMGWVLEKPQFRID